MFFTLRQSRGHQEFARRSLVLNIQNRGTGVGQDRSPFFEISSHFIFAYSPAGTKMCFDFKNDCAGWYVVPTPRTPLMTGGMGLCSKHSLKKNQICFWCKHVDGDFAVFSQDQERGAGSRTVVVMSNVFCEGDAGVGNSIFAKKSFFGVCDLSCPKPAEKTFPKIHLTKSNLAFARTPSARFRKKCFQILFLVYMEYKSSIANKSTRGGFLFYVSTPKILSGLFFESRTWSPNERVGSKKLVGQFHIGRPFILPRTNEDCCASAQKNGRWQFVTGSEWMILYLKYIVL